MREEKIDIIADVVAPYELALSTWCDCDCDFSSQLFGCLGLSVIVTTWTFTLNFIHYPLVKQRNHSRNRTVGTGLKDRIVCVCVCVCVCVFKNKNACFSCPFINVRKRSCGKVMFSHLSVSHSVHGGGHAWQGRGVHGRGAYGRVCVVGGTCGEGVCIVGGRAWQERRPLQRTVRILLGCFLVRILILLCGLRHDSNSINGIQFFNFEINNKFQSLTFIPSSFKFFFKMEVSTYFRAVSTSNSLKSSWTWWPPGATICQTQSTLCG